MVCTLAEVRKAKGMTQAQLAEQAKVNRVCIAKYETGKALPSIVTAEKLAGALGVGISDIVKAG